MSRSSRSRSASAAPVEKKQLLYKRIAELFEQNPGIRRQNVVIQLTEVDRAKWSFGDGEAQYVPK